MQYALTGEFIDAARAYEIGLINEVTDGPALEAANALAKQIIQEQAEWSKSDMWTEQQALMRPVFTSQDTREGAAAFAEKRAPRWTGK